MTKMIEVGNDFFDHLCHSLFSEDENNPLKNKEIDFLIELKKLLRFRKSIVSMYIAVHGKITQTQKKSLNSHVLKMYRSLKNQVKGGKKNGRNHK